MDEINYWLGWSVFPGVGPGKFKLLLDHFGTAKNAWDADQPELKNIIGEKLALDFKEFRKIFSIEDYLKKLEEKNVWFLTQKDPQYPSLLLQIDKPPIILFGKGNFGGDSDQGSIRTEQSAGRLTHISNDAQRELSESSTFSPSSLSESRQPGINKKNKDKLMPTFSSFEIHDQPPIDFNTIAVVGTRKVTSYGREVTEILTGDLVRAGFVIVSGLAMGVDAVAHKTAIENNGRTIAVLGCGVDLCYPSSNKKLYDEIINGNGVVISEFPIGMTPSVGSFPSRNRIIAGLSLGVLVTEGAEDSGSLITADYALKYQRKVFAVPGQITSGLSRGPSKLIQRGAKLVTGANDILEEFQISSVRQTQDKFQINTNGGTDSGQVLRSQDSQDLGTRMTSNLQNLTKEEERVLKILENEPLHFDEIARIVNLDSSKTGTLLTMMEIKGMIKSLDSGYFKIV